MTTGRLQRGAWTQGALLALALLAIVIRVGVPPGFMADPTGGAGLVLCTSHSPASTDGKSAPASTHPDIPCAFAGHLALAADDAPVLVASTAWQAAPAVQIAQPDQTPGRGLAAPPPPAVGPPALI